MTTSVKKNNGSFKTKYISNMVSPGLKMLPSEVAPMPQVIAGYADSAFALDESDNLDHRKLGRY